jgi:hypothetical protein
MSTARGEVDFSGNLPNVVLPLGNKAIVTTSVALHEVFYLKEVKHPSMTD